MMRSRSVLLVAGALFLGTSGCGVNFRLCNGTGESVTFDSGGDRVTVEPCTCMTATISFDDTSVPVSVSDAAAGTGDPLMTRDVSLFDGFVLTYDGSDLVQTFLEPDLSTCNVSPPPLVRVDITLCNEDSRTNASAVILMAADEELLTSNNVNPGNCRTAAVLAGHSISIEAWDNEGVVLLDECTLNNPGDGDQVVWDGTQLTCVN